MDDAVWRKRFFAYMLARLGGLIVFFLGIAIAYTNMVRPGGWPQVGAVIAILGVLDTLLLPRLVKKKWERRDAERR